MLGAVYLAAAFIQVLGFLAAIRLKQDMVMQVDALFSVLSTTLIIGAGVLRVVVHTALKTDVIGECTVLAAGRMVETRIGIWGPRMGMLAPRFAAILCTREWSRDSTFEIISLMAAVSALLVIVSVLNGVHKGVQQGGNSERGQDLCHDGCSHVFRSQIPARCFCNAVAVRSESDKGVLV
ncbi:hypothetical protein OF83DRAFT_816875 [Amylostereum chailletii]|nr:hypothetical protein OF83DRAFT_816875 [Amylostereum chailletii]